MNTPIHRLAGAALALSLLGCNPDFTVQTVSSWGLPVAGVQVKIDDGQWVATDADGKATFHDPQDPFVLHVHQSVTRTDSGGATSHSDTFLDLQNPSEREVTLQVDDDGPSAHEATLSGTLTGASGGPVTLSLAGDVSSSPAQVPGNGPFSLGTWLAHPGPFHSVLRALESDGASPPRHYAGYGEVEVTLGDQTTGAPANVALALKPVSEGVVSGTVTPPPSFPATASTGIIPFLRFPVGSMPLTSFAASGPFSVVVPQVSTSQALLTAVAGGWSSSATSFHQRKVSVPSSDVTFDLPEAAQLIEPFQDTTANVDAAFRWTNVPAGGKSALSLSCYWTDSAGDWHSLVAGVYEITGYQASLPVGVQALLPAYGDMVSNPGSGGGCSWSVMWYPADSHVMTALEFYTADEFRFSVSQNRHISFR